MAVQPKEMFFTPPEPPKDFLGRLVFVGVHAACGAVANHKGEKWTYDKTKPVPVLFSTPPALTQTATTLAQEAEEAHGKTGCREGIFAEVKFLKNIPPHPNDSFITATFYFPEAALAAPVE